MKYAIDISKITLPTNFDILCLSLFFLSLFIFSDSTNKIAPVTEMDLHKVLTSGYYDNKSNFVCPPEFEELALRLKRGSSTMTCYHIFLLLKIHCRRCQNNTKLLLKILETNI